MAEGRLYWLKLPSGFFKRHDIKYIRSQPNGRDLLLFYLSLMLESLDHGGRLRFSDSLPYTEEQLASATDTKPSVVKYGMQFFKDHGFMEVLEDGTFFMTQVPKLTTSETTRAAGMREIRAKELDGNIVEQSGTSGNKMEQCSQRIEIRDKILDSPPYSPPPSGEGEKPKKKKPIGVSQHEASEMLIAWTPNGRLQEVMLEFIANRTEKDRRDVVTQKALKLAIAKLDRECDNDAEKIETIESSIIAGYKGLFPNKKNANNPGGTRSAHDFHYDGERTYTPEEFAAMYEDLSKEPVEGKENDGS